MSFTKAATLLIILFFYSILTFSKTPDFLHFGIEDGLPSDVVYRVYTDHNGYLWFATDKGVSKFNGTKFVNYNTLSGMSDNVVFFMKEDWLYRLWFGTFNGELCYYQNDTIYTAFKKPYLKLPFKSTIKGVHFSKDSSVTFSFDNNNFINIKDDKISYFSFPRMIDYVLKNTNNTFKIYNDSNEVLLNEFGKEINIKKGINKGLKLAYDNNSGQFFLLSNQGILNTNRRLVIPIKGLHKDYFIPYLYIDQNGRYFICTKQGVLTNNSEILLKNIPVSSVTKDINGNYWISTLGYGVFKITKNQQEITEYNLNLPSVESIASAIIQNKKIYFSTINNSKYEFNLTNQKLTKTLNRASYIIDQSNSYLHNNRHEGHLFLSNGEKIRMPKEYIPKNIIRKNDIYYFINHSEINIYALQTTNRHNLSFIKNINLNTRINSSLYNNDTKNLWISTVKGLCIVTPQKNYQLKVFEGKVLRHFTFCGNAIIAINDKGKLLLCDNYKDSTPTIRELDNYNTLWQGSFHINKNSILLFNNSNYGVLSVTRNAKANTTKFHFIKNPLIPINPEIITKDSDHFFFIKKGKVISVDNRNLLIPSNPDFKIRFTSIRTKDQAYLPKDTIKLSYEQAKSIKISFDVIGFQNEEILTYYSISSIKNQWNTVNSKTIDLYSLPYGRYTIKLKAKILGSASSKETSVSFVIKKPFWATWSFIIAISISTIALIGLIIYIIVRRYKKKNETKYLHLLTCQKLEFKALNALMNPHFIFNCLNSIQGLINENDKKAANKYLVTFSGLIRQNMHNISSDKITLKQEIKLVEYYLEIEKLRFENNINYAINIEKDIDTDTILIPPLIIQPLVENAIKHGLMLENMDNDSVKINIYRENRNIHIDVINRLNYPQKTDKSEHISYGLKNITKRINYLKDIDGIEIYFKLFQITNNDGFDYIKANICIKENHQIAVDKSE